MNDLDTLAYAQVEQERAHGYFAPGLRSKAFADAGGDLQRAEAIYIKYRAEQIKQEYLREIARRKEEERERQKAAQKEKERQEIFLRYEKGRRAAEKGKRKAGVLKEILDSVALTVMALLILGVILNFFL